MHQFCSLFVDQYVLDVSVTQTHDVADCGHKTENRRFVFTITGSSFGDYKNLVAANVYFLILCHD